MHIADVLRKTIHNPATWSKQELYDNLQAAVDVELWTIPLYLTTLYSIQGLNANNQQAYPATAKLIESVVIQEMLHLELISNLCNALGYAPQYPFPTYEEAEGIPFLKPDVPPKYAGYQVQLGPLDINQLKLFCVIELPEPAGKPDWNKQTRYNSIGELYQALEIAVSLQWKDLYVGAAANTKQQANFTDYTQKNSKGIGFSQTINSLDQALAAMQAIVKQGEGNRATEEIPPRDQPPAENPANYDPSDFDPSQSHFLKFNEILNILLLDARRWIPATYPLIPNPDKQQLAEQAQAQIQLQTGFRAFLSELQTGFNAAQPNQQMPDSFYTSMFNLQNLITAVWQTGAVPAFPTH
ncbi:ferritin-like protein [Chromobacterium sp. IIBBL 290-4]|uniref:ferritin-like protein n=1 Tax=Chromobacterium sp. IIBBL 290-4 TaxID=2953890 RepID=UPI0020B6FED8|nr:ferritin-like protein [Chromobacterium sp. IIBBL 290-4]UTH76291.1 ferritin-like protein [Chromobacterium sp. IIBBL 290-4]